MGGWHTGASADGRSDNAGPRANLHSGPGQSEAGQPIQSQWPATATTPHPDGPTAERRLPRPIPSSRAALPGLAALGTAGRRAAHFSSAAGRGPP
eukprot:13469500-Alexandrium_andersonii.AAC.1